MCKRHSPWGIHGNVPYFVYVSRKIGSLLRNNLDFPYISIAHGSRGSVARVHTECTLNIVCSLVSANDLMVSAVCSVHTYFGITWPFFLCNLYYCEAAALVRTLGALGWDSLNLRSVYFMWSMDDRYRDRLQAGWQLTLSWLSDHHAHDTG